MTKEYIGKEHTIDNTPTNVTETCNLKQILLHAILGFYKMCASFTNLSVNSCHKEWWGLHTISLKKQLQRLNLPHPAVWPGLCIQLWYIYPSSEQNSLAKSAAKGTFLLLLKRIKDCFSCIDTEYTFTPLLSKKEKKKTFLTGRLWAKQHDKLKERTEASL